MHILKRLQINKIKPRPPSLSIRMDLFNVIKDVIFSDLPFNNVKYPIANDTFSK